MGRKRIGPNPVTVDEKCGEVEMSLHRGKRAIVALADYPRVRDHRWQLVGPWPDGPFYAKSARPTLYLHRLLSGVGPQDPMESDPTVIVALDNNPLNCLPHNLKICRKSEVWSHRPTKSEKYFGVMRKADGEWMAWFRGESCGVGLNELHAAALYDRAVYEALPDGGGVPVNFPGGVPDDVLEATGIISDVFHRGRRLDINGDSFANVAAYRPVNATVQSCHVRDSNAPVRRYQPPDYWDYPLVRHQLSNTGEGVTHPAPAIRANLPE